MSCLLLTGATGLLGSYLLRDASERQIPMAVVARSSRTAGRARQRIEDQLVRWERISGRAYPRPVVFEGDLSLPALGLSEPQLDWLAENCHAVLHNAASLTFVADEPDGEPYRSNVAGVRNVLDLCERTGIAHFHHVSTAYVCGLREDRVLESDVDVGQTPGNDYERSKLEAERLVRQSPHLRSVTVFRPAIIVGDSASGYTSTFHGLYVPLKAACGLVQAIATGEHVDLSSLLDVFSLDGSEKKNFVPVDWVSAAMTEIVDNPSLHNQTYHLAPPERTEVGLLAEVIQETLLEALIRESQEPKDDDSGQRRESGQRPKPNPQRAASPMAFSESLKEQMEVYRSYWRDDPIFDIRNTNAALPRRPAPVVDRAMLKRMCGFAIRSNFGWPKPPPQIPPLDTASLMASLVQDSSDNAPLPDNATSQPSTHLVGFSFSGPGGGDWCLTFRNGVPVGVSEGLRHGKGPVIRMNTTTLDHLLARKMDRETAVASGRVHWENDTPTPHNASHPVNGDPNGRVIDPVSATRALDAFLDAAGATAAVHG